MPILSRNRKAQVTVFIIIGLIVLMSAGVYVYLRSTGISPTQMFQPKSPPVVEFVEACMEQTATEAIRLMGNQGGYLELPPQIAANPTMYVSLIPGIGGRFSPKVPYWYYEGQMINPSIEYMQFQAENYVNRNLAGCINNFTSLSDEYIVTEKEPYEATLLFTEKEAIIQLDYEIFIQPRGKQEITTVKSFTTRLDVQVRKMWELAVEILEKENTMTFFENMTINLMSSHPADDIPFSGLSFECGRKQWLLPEIKQKVNYALEPAVSGVRFSGTYNPGFPLENEDRYLEIENILEAYDRQERLGAERDAEGRITHIPGPRLPSDIPEDAYEYFQYYFRFTDKNYRDLRVAAAYKDEWGMNLVATPNQHGVLKSGKQDLKSEIMSFLCMQSYHFVYDVVYPVMISINDPDAFNGRGYVFRYAFPVQIFHNKPDRQLLPSRVIEPVVYATEYCTNRGGEEYVIRAQDITTNEQLSKVNLTFICFTEVCNLGRTRSDNRNLEWKGQFPEGCYAPIIRANRSEYLEVEKQFDYTDPFVMNMYPLQKVKFDVKRHPENVPEGSERMLEADMYAVIQLTSDNPEYSVFEHFGADDVFEQTRTIDLLRADSVYDVNIMLIKRGQGDAEDQMIGGWMGNWTVDMREMLDAEEVVFHVPQKYPLPSSDEDFMKVYELMTNRSKCASCVPQIIRADEATGMSDTGAEGAAGAEGASGAEGGAGAGGAGAGGT